MNHTGRMLIHFMVVDGFDHQAFYLDFVEILCMAIDLRLDSTTFRMFPYSKCEILARII